MAANYHDVYVCVCVNKPIFCFSLLFADNSTDFWATDVKWFSLLESTNWLEIIRFALSSAFCVSDCW